MYQVVNFVCFTATPNSSVFLGSIIDEEMLIVETPLWDVEKNFHSQWLPKDFSHSEWLPKDCAKLFLSKD